MRVLLDTNIVLDVLLNRVPWFNDSQAVWQTHEKGKVRGHIAASTLTNIFYISRRSVGLATAHGIVRECLRTFDICPVDRYALEQATRLIGSDFEDNLQIACATIAGVDAIVTRDKGGFAAAPMIVLTPSELLAQVK